MIRTLLWLFGGVLLGGIIHIVVILTLPLLAEETAWTRIEALEAGNRMLVLPPVLPGEPNPLHLDPELAYGLCRVDLTQGPAFLSGVLPDAFWSVAIFNPAGIVTYSTTNRDGIGQTVELGIFNAAQTALLAQQQIDIAEGLLVVEAQSDQLAVLVRLAPPHAAMRPRFEQELSEITCGPKG
ncbi:MULTISPECIES: hypothetical protein [Devosia]|uniref:DUF1254 domain-containing protein n=1 Tax=Devosia equisanguinis TaxID=2490941 RepID=A0A3S4CVC5_9HYPH|nr:MULTISPECIES: hypothetical protein [Devosia]ODT47406.1 MAG: hypothetical protein ABS74_14095 [Pelagibacterium sp. SCN 63-126]ODU87083.1 MAG: hypothetical protein ABT14_06510 [Pelagibacterium sp. SCN 63-17]OJX42886.1 MAG: hypothetical protein BGO80_15775 [Devosia sp. 63-57]VDS06661.1 hypothetical protein DEVEQU_03825 [Devosia equisanguinis]